MNIIFHRYNSICEPDYIDAFGRLGIDVIEDDIQIKNKNVSVEKMVENLGRLVLENQPLFVFSINYFPFISIICEKINVKYVCVSVDCPVMEIYNTTIRNSCNKVFLFDHEQYLSVKDENPDGIFHLPLGAATERLDECLGEYTGKPEGGYLYDVSFVGSLYNEKDKYSKIRLSEYDRGRFDGILKVQTLFPGLWFTEEIITEELTEVLKNADPEFYSSEMSVRDLDRFVAVNDYLSYHLAFLDRVKILTHLPQNIGNRQEHFFTLSDTKILKSGGDNRNLIIHGGVSSLKEMPEVFRRSRINLNHTMRSIKTGLPQRIWDILGSGGFLITNDQAEIPEYLEPGLHLETYGSMEELTDKVNYYLLHEDERERIALAGYEAVKNRHTVLQRTMEMIRQIQD